MTVIEQIKAEIERRLKNTRDYMNGAGMKYKGPKYHASRGRESAYDAILSFLSGLEKSEKPIISGDNLDSVIDTFWNTASGYQPKFVTLEVKKDGFEKIAHYFAQWQKEQMMEEAVEGEVCIPNVWVEHKEGKELVVRAEISKELGFKFGDKVRIIIVKED